MHKNNDYLADLRKVKTLVSSAIKRIFQRSRKQCPEVSNPVHQYPALKQSLDNTEIEFLYRNIHRTKFYVKEIRVS